MPKRTRSSPVPKRVTASPRISISLRATRAIIRSLSKAGRNELKPRNATTANLPELPATRPVLKVKEAAVFLNISVSHVRALIDSGCLTAGSVSVDPEAPHQHLRVTRESVLRFRELRFQGW